MQNQELIKIQQTYLRNSEYWLNHYRFFLRFGIKTQPTQPQRNQLLYPVHPGRIILSISLKKRNPIVKGSKWVSYKKNKYYANFN